VRFGGWPLTTQRGGEGPLGDSPWESGEAGPDSVGAQWQARVNLGGPCGPRRLNGPCEALTCVGPHASTNLTAPSLLKAVPPSVALRRGGVRWHIHRARMQALLRSLAS
jgi:hypothetical protein